MPAITALEVLQPLQVGKVESRRCSFVGWAALGTSRPPVPSAASLSWSLTPHAGLATDSGLGAQLLPVWACLLVQRMGLCELLWTWVSGVVLD